MAQYTVEILDGLHEIDRDTWDGLEKGGTPFLEWDWLASLEEAGCASAAEGWAPQHVLLREGGRLVAACPLYVKGHSQGEFVFDYQWAHAARRAGIDYYPKLLVAIPFTPATGARILTAPGADRGELIEVMGGALQQICGQSGLSSVHVNFCRGEEVEGLRAAGFVERTGVQYHWENPGLRDFEDYLSLFRSKRRNKIRREVREMAAQGIEIEALAGEEIPDGLIPVMYRLYAGHVEKLFWGNRYLNRAFFDLLARRFKRHLCFVVARQHGRVLAGTVNVEADGVFYGRYWGAFEERRHLHFNVCYYAAIDHCIRRGIRRFEPGAGGEFKQLRGFDARLTHSMHHFEHPGLAEAVEGYLAREREHTRHAVDYINTFHSQLKVPGR